MAHIWQNYFSLKDMKFMVLFEEPVHLIRAELIIFMLTLIPLKLNYFCIMEILLTLANLVYNIQPEEIYHLGAQSHVRVSFDIPEYTEDITGLGTTRLLEAIRRSGVRTKFSHLLSMVCIRTYC